VRKSPGPPGTEIDIHLAISSWDYKKSMPSAHTQNKDSFKITFERNFELGFFALAGVLNLETKERLLSDL
jgi:hypothetical protein